MPETSRELIWSETVPSETGWYHYCYQGEPMIDAICYVLSTGHGTDVRHPISGWIPPNSDNLKTMRFGQRIPSPEELAEQSAETERLLDKIFQMYHAAGQIEGGDELEAVKRLRAERDRLKATSFTTSELAAVRGALDGSKSLRQIGFDERAARRRKDFQEADTMVYRRKVIVDNIEAALGILKAREVQP